MINKQLFGLFAILGENVDFTFSLNQDGKLTNLSFFDSYHEYKKDEIDSYMSLNISYDRTTFCGKEIIHPTRIHVLFKDIANGCKLSAYDALYVKNDISNDDKLVFRSDGGVTEKFQKLYCTNHGYFTIPDTMKYILYHWLPVSIIYRNPAANKTNCDKTIYFKNQKIEHIVGKDIESKYPDYITKTEDIYSIFHNSGFKYSMNRMLYNVREYNEKSSSDIYIKIQYPIKMVDPYYDDREGQINEYEFDQFSVDTWVAYETYSTHKGSPVIRTVIYTLDDQGRITNITYPEGGYGSAYNRYKTITYTSNVDGSITAEVVTKTIDKEENTGDWMETKF